MVSLSLVIPATNSPPHLQACLDAIASSTSPPDETIVIRRPPLASPASARNAGAAAAVGDVLVFVDADVLVHPDALARVREHFDRDPSLGAVFGAYDDTVATLRLAAAFRNLLHHHVHTRAAGPAETFWTGLGAVRADRLALVGGFDGALFRRSSIEDVELGMRLTDVGTRILLDPAIRGTHLKDWSVRQMLHTDLTRRGIPWVALLAERRRIPSSLNLGWLERTSTLVALASAGFLIRRRTALAFGLGAVLVALNHRFYRVLAGRLGVARAISCVPLHVAHHITGALAVPLGLVRVIARRSHADE